MRAPPALVKTIVELTGELLLGSPCDMRKSLQELIGKPKTFIELSLGLEDHLEAGQLKVLKDVRQAQLDLDAVQKISSSAHGLAYWLTALSEYSHHSGLIKKAKFIPTAKKREMEKQQW